MIFINFRKVSLFVSRFFPNPIQWNWSWIFCYFLKNFWAYFWLESKTMVFVRSSKVTNGWLVTIHDPESFIVTLQGYALQGYNGFLGVIHGYQFHWSLSRTLQMVHFSAFKSTYSPNWILRERPWVMEFLWGDTVHTTVYTPPKNISNNWIRKDRW